MTNQNSTPRPVRTVAVARVVAFRMETAARRLDFVKALCRSSGR